MARKERRAARGGRRRITLETHACVADLDDEVGKLEAVSDGAGGGGHVAREPVDGASAGVEGHLAGALRRARQPPHSRPACSLRDGSAAPRAAGGGVVVGGVMK